MEKRFSADSIVRSRLDSRNFPKDSKHYDTSHKKELLDSVFEVVPPITDEKCIGTASKQYVVQSNSAEISKHKWIKKCCCCSKRFQLTFISRGNNNGQSPRKSFERTVQTR